MIKKIKLYDHLQNEVISVPFKAPVTRIDRYQEIEGRRYILHIIKADGVEKRRIFIQRDK